MRIGKERKPCEVKFGNGLKTGEVFCYRGKYDSKEELYMKIQRVEYDVTRCGEYKVYRYNAVNLKDGYLTFVDNDDTVTIANVRIEKD